MRILHFSDVHVQLPGWRSRKLAELGPLRALATAKLWLGRGAAYDDAAEVLRRIVRAVDTERADHAILTGDLTQLGHREEFALARELLGPLLPDRLTLLAGNHDRYPIAGRPNRCFEEFFPGQPANDLSLPLPVRLVGEAALISLDSAGALSWPNLSPGRLSERDARALRTTLAAPQLTGRCKLVLVHHAPQRPAFSARVSLRGYRPVVRAAAEGGAAAILCGHVHERRVSRGTPWIVNVGSSTERGEEGYFLLELDAGGLRAVKERKPA